MSQRAFDALVPAADAEHARWVVDGLSTAGGRGVTSVIPGGFAAYARLLHPLPGGETWDAVAPVLTGPGREAYEYPYASPLLTVEGELEPAAVDALAGVLAAATSTPDRCHFGLWNGWGWLHESSTDGLYVVGRRHSPPARWRSARALAQLRRRHERAMQDVYEFVGACPVAWVAGDRPMLLFDGPIAGVDAIGYDSLGSGTLARQSPQWWWPSDRAWFVATEIDYPWTYVAGTERLVESVLALDDFESVRIEPDALW